MPLYCPSCIRGIIHLMPSAKRKRNQKTPHTGRKVSDGKPRSDATVPILAHVTANTDGTVPASEIKSARTAARRKATSTAATRYHIYDQHGRLIEDMERTGSDWSGISSNEVDR